MEGGETSYENNKMCRSVEFLPPSIFVFPYSVEPIVTQLSFLSREESGTGVGLGKFISCVMTAPLSRHDDFKDVERVCSLTAHQDPLNDNYVLREESQVISGHIECHVPNISRGSDQWQWSSTELAQATVR